MNPIAAISSVLRQYVSFRGVASRFEYWWWTLAVFLVGQVLNGMGSALGGDSSSASSIGSLFQWLAGIVALGTFLPSWAVLVRRFHDAGFSGRWLWLYAGPLTIGIIVAPAAIGVIGELFALPATSGQFVTLILQLVSIAMIPLLAGIAVAIFVFVVTVSPTKTAEAGNKHTR